MKKFNLFRLLAVAFILSLFAPLQSFADGDPDDVVLDVFIHDKDGKQTNYRDKPSGTIIGQTSTSATISLNIDYVKNGWWHILGGEIFSYDSSDDDGATVLNDGEAWVHYSVLATSTRNYGGQTLYLRESPSEKSKSVFSFKNERLLRPIDIKPGWVKVKTLDGKHTGWIQTIWLCGNPLTNCC